MGRSKGRLQHLFAVAVLAVDRLQAVKPSPNTRSRVCCRCQSVTVACNIGIKVGQALDISCARCQSCSQDMDFGELTLHLSL